VLGQYGPGTGRSKFLEEAMSLTKVLISIHCNRILAGLVKLMCFEELTWRRNQNHNEVKNQAREMVLSPRPRSLGSC
jgi:hypothetical protein